MRFPLLPLLLALCLAHVARAQMQMFKRLSAPVVRNGKMLETPFAGGLNNPQFSAADLNRDGVQDLVVFDRGGDVVLTYLNEGIAGEVSYTYAPEYACFFPKLIEYALLRDYNGDGAADIFCASLQDGSSEMQVFQGYYEGNILKFKPFLFFYPKGPSGQVYDPRYIWYPASQPGFWNNLSISKTDVPAVDDIDGDGDLDIVTFPAGNSVNLSFLRNESVETGYGKDSLKFRLVDNCWGRFYENGMEACRATLSDDPGCCAPCFAPGKEITDDREERHPGASVLTFDEDADADKDVLLGNVSFDCLSLLTNGGDTEQAWMTDLDTLFPSYNTTIELDLFPAGFYLDLNNDGRKDLMVAPNSKNASEDRNCAWFYKNTATSGHHFELTTRTLLVDEMIDFGTVAHPAIADVNADGLPDLVIGNGGYYIPTVSGGSRTGSLYLFLNTGTPGQPRFQSEDDDWLGMSQYAPNDFDFAPAFGDLDGDGDLDLLVGNYGGWLYCYRNIAGAGNPMVFMQDFNPMWVTMDVGISSTPVIADLDGDGLQDVIMGEFQGNINFFKNMGTASDPLFGSLPTIAKIGGVDTETTLNGIGYSAPALFSTPGGLNLVTGGLNGSLQAYGDVKASADPFTALSLTWGNLDEGSRSSPALADLDDDGVLELVIGNQRGGLSLFKTVMVDCTVPVKTQEPGAALALNVSPNPAHTFVRVQWPSDALAQWWVFDALGRQVTDGESAGGSFYISVTNWKSGIYFLEVLTGTTRGTAKIAVE